MTIPVEGRVVCRQGQHEILKVAELKVEIKVLMSPIWSVEDEVVGWICQLGGNVVPRTDEVRKNNLEMVQPSLAPALVVLGAVPAGPATPMPEGSAPREV